MTREDAIELATRLSNVKPDRGNKYASRTVRTKGAAAYEQWALTCRQIAYMVCVTQRIVSEAAFYEACGME